MHLRLVSSRSRGLPRAASWALLVAVLLAWAPLADAHISDLGYCPNGLHRPLQPADLQRLAGSWYEQLRYLEPATPASCTRLFIQPAANRSVALTERSLAAGQRYESSDRARLDDDGQLRSDRFQYGVVTTDARHRGLVVLQKCQQHDYFHVRTLLVLSRRRRPVGGSAGLRRLVEDLRRRGVFTEQLQPTPQIDCPDMD